MSNKKLQNELRTIEFELFVNLDKDLSIAYDPTGQILVEFDKATKEQILNDKENLKSFIDNYFPDIRKELYLANDLQLPKSKQLKKP